MNEKSRCIRKKRPTEKDCLYCILQRLNMNLNCLVRNLGYATRIPLAHAVIFYRIMNDIDTDYMEFMKWVEKYHPEIGIVNPLKKLAETFELQAKKFGTPVV